MASKATVFKVNLQISDIDRAYYNDLSLMIAQHPSETNERTMVRLLAFAMHASEELKFTEGISADEEPDIWQKNFSSEIEIWIDVGRPDEKRIRKACSRSSQVYIYAYGGRTVKTWWQPLAEKTNHYKNLKVMALPQPATLLLAELVQKTMALQCTIQDGQIWIGDSEKNVFVVPEFFHGKVS